jgi:hypothetical protein
MDTVSCDSAGVRPSLRPVCQLRKTHAQTIYLFAVTANGRHGIALAPQEGRKLLIIAQSGPRYFRLIHCY